MGLVLVVLVLLELLQLLQLLLLKDEGLLLLLLDRCRRCHRSQSVFVLGMLLLRVIVMGIRVPHMLISIAVCVRCLRSRIVVECLIYEVELQIERHFFECLFERPFTHEHK